MHHITVEKDDLKLQVVELEEKLSGVASTLSPSCQVSYETSRAEALVAELTQEKSALVLEVKELSFQLDQVKAQQAEMEGVYQTELREAGEVLKYSQY